MKKYIIEILLLAVFIGTCYLGYLYKRKPTIQPTINNAIQSEIDSIKRDNIVIDSSIHYHITKVTNISNHYENEKNNIDSIPHDSLLSYIRAELRHFNERGEFQVSQNYN
jgi:hypothetical protein